MIIGIDVGGTHTDGVLLSRGQVRRTNKVLTRLDTLDQSILRALDELLVGENLGEIQRIVFSTTLTTNLIAQHRYPPTGLVLIPGPGMQSDSLLFATTNWVLSGSIDHRGRKVADLCKSELERLVTELKTSGIRDVAIVGKFSTRNPILEEEVAVWIRDHLPEIENIQLGHRVSASLNFPRRVQTTWLNTAVHREYANFLHNVEHAVRERGITAKLYLLKADGGTMPLSDGLRFGVETIKSGPAASIMGFLALAENERRTALLLDVGGSTTDIALMTGGAPLFEPDGVQADAYLTSVRGLLSRSIPYGGDSPVAHNNANVRNIKNVSGVVITGDVKNKIGQNTDTSICDNTSTTDCTPNSPSTYLSSVRRGPALVFGGNVPTLTDALAVLGLMQGGDLSRAREALSTEMARAAVTAFYTHVHTAVDELLVELNERPVYTIQELLDNSALQPELLLVVGGPAQAILSGLADELGLKPVLPAFHHVANALGAAIARPTVQHTLYADTAQKFYTLSGMPGKQPIRRHFGLADAREILLEHTKKALLEMAILQPQARNHTNDITQSYAHPPYSSPTDFHASSSSSSISGSSDSNQLDSRTSDISPSNDGTHVSSSSADNAQFADDLIEITRAESFNIVRGFSTVGQILKLEAQIKPGIDPALHQFFKKGGMGV